MGMTTKATNPPPMTAALTEHRLRRRGLARLADAAILATGGISVGLVTGFGPGWLIATTGIVYGYFVAFAMTGATPGKRAVGLRIVGPDGGPPSLRASAGRELFVLVGAIPFAGPVLSLAAWAAIAVTSRKSTLGQGVHDRLAGGTRVVERRTDEQ